MPGLRSRTFHPVSRPVVTMAAFLAVFGSFLCLMSRAGWAETRVWMEADAMHLHAENARLSEVLAAISAQFKVLYPSHPSLERPISGTYSGTLRHVLSRILDRSNYVLRFSGEEVEIKIFDVQNGADRLLASPVVAVTQAPALPKGAVPTMPASSQVAPLVPK
jgi:hypothetical protein